MKSVTRSNAMFFKLLLSVSLIFSVETTIDVVDITVKNCFSHYMSLDSLSSIIKPELYDVSLELTTNIIFNGQVNISFELLLPASKIILHVYEQKIDIQTITLATQSGDMFFQPFHFDYCQETQTLAIYFRTNLAPDNYILFLKFQGYLNGSQGFIMIKFKDNKEHLSFVDRYIFVTLVKPTGARSVFPCWDVPMMKAQFNINVTYPNIYTATSTIPLESNWFINTKYRKTSFKSTSIMSTYLLTIALMDDNYMFLATRDFHLLTSVTMFQEIQYAMHAITQVFQLFARFGYKSLTKQIITYPNLPVKAMGGGQLSIFRETDLVYTKNLDFPGRELEIRKIISQELTHLWLENFANQLQLKDLWFNKALAFYMSYQITQESQSYKNLRMADLYIVQVMQPALHNDVILHVPPVASKYDPFYFTYIYKKASAMIRMIHVIVGDLTFRNTVLEYVSKSQYKQLTLDDFWKLLKRYTLKSDVELSVIMNTWLMHQYYPRMYVERFESNRPLWCAQEPVVKPQKGDKPIWEIPIIFMKKSMAGSSEEMTMYWLRSYGINIFERALANWPLFHLHQIGFIRVNYDSLTWRKIASYLQSSEYSRIHAISRAQLIDDAYHLVLEKQLNSFMFLEIIEYLKQESDYIPWHTMFNILHYMSPYLELPESLNDKLKLLVLLDKLLKKIGYKENALEDNMRKALRLLAIKWACRLGHAECSAMMNDKLVAHFNYPKNNSILPWWRNLVYCTGMRQASFNTWKMMLQMFIQTKDTSYLEYIACVDSPLILEKIILNNNEENSNFNSNFNLRKLINNNHYIQIYNFIVKKHARREIVLDIILYHFKQTNYRLRYERLLHIIMSIYDKVQLNKVWKTANDIVCGVELQKINAVLMYRLAQLNKYNSTFPKN